MMRIFFSCTLLSTVFCHAAFGQVDANTCVRLANVIAVGNATHISDEQYNAMRYYANCEASQSGTSAGLDVAYQAFSLGAKYSDAKRNEYCSKSYDSYNIRTMDYNTAKQFFTQALPTIDKCIDAAAKGWDIRYDRIGDDAITLNISNRAAQGGRLLGIDIIPTQSLTCTPRPPTAPVAVTPATPIAMTCLRTPTQQIVDGMQITSAPNVAVNLRLTDALLCGPASRLFVFYKPASATEN